MSFRGRGCSAQGFGVLGDSWSGSPVEVVKFNIDTAYGERHVALSYGGSLIRQERFRPCGAHGWASTCFAVKGED